MPEPPDPSPPPQPKLHTADQFGDVIRRLYPALGEAEPDNRRLTHAVLMVHPELKEHVIDPLEGAELLPYNPATTRMVPKPYDWEHPGAPPSPIPPEDDVTPMSRRASAKTGGSTPTTVGEMRAGVRAQSEGVGGAAGEILATPVTGAVRAARGVSEISRAMPGARYPETMPPPNVVQGAADVIGGGMEAGSLFVPEQLAAAPFETAVGLGTGSAVAYGAQKAAEALGAPPDVTSLVSELSGLIAGVGSAHVAGAPARARAAFERTPYGPADQPDTRAIIAEGQRVRDERAMQAEFQRGNEQADEDESLQRVLQYRNQVEGDKQTAALRAGMAENEKLHAAAILHKEGTLSANSPFEYFDNVRALPPPPEPAGLLGPGQPATFLAAPPGYNPNAVDITRPGATDIRALPIATSTEPPPVSPEPEPTPENTALAVRPPGPPPPIDPRLSEMIDSFSRVPPTGTGQPPERQALPPARGSGRVIYGAEPGARIETVGEKEPLVAQSAGGPPPDINTLGEQLASQLEYQPQGGPPRPTEPTRVKMTERAAFRQRVQDTADRIASEMEGQPYTPPKLVSDTSKGVGESYYVPPAGGSEWYNRLVKDVANPPNRKTITEYYRAYADGKGVKGEDLPDDVVKRGMDALGLRSESAFRRSYESWRPDIEKLVQKRVAQSMAWERIAREREAGENVSPSAGTPGEPVTPASGPPPEAAGGATGAEGVAGPPPPPVEELPDFLQNLEGDETAVGGYEPEELAARQSTQPGAPPVPEGEGPPPVPEGRTSKFPDLENDALAQHLNTVYGEEGELPTYGVQKNTGGELTDEELANARKKLAAQRAPLFERLAGEEGALTLPPAPSNWKGLKAWYDKHADEFGNEEWYQLGSAAVEAGDRQTAWRAAALAYAHYHVPAGAVAGEKQQATPAPADFKSTPQYASLKKSVEQAIGEPLPRGTDISPLGIITFPENPGHLQAKFSDLALGKTFLNDVLGQVDPSSIIRVETSEGKLDEGFVREHPEMRITAQMADQIVRDMPDAVREAFEDTGLTTTQIGAHFRRAFRQAGQVLHMAKQWQDNNWDSILHLDPLTGSTAGPGAAGRLEFLPPERGKAITDYLNAKRGEFTNPEVEQILGDMQKLTPKQLTEIGFDLPDGVKPDSKEATTYTRNWLGRQRKLLQLGKQIDLIAADAPVDRALVAASLGATDETVPGKIRETYLSLMRARLSFLVSQTSTAFHVLGSQGLRYTFGIPEEIMAGAADLVMGNREGADGHFTLAKNFVKGYTRPGAVPEGLFKRPWSDGVSNLFEYSTEMLRTLDPEDVRHTVAAMETEAPDAARHMFATLTLGQENPEIPGSTHVINPKITNFLTAGMRLHAAVYRSLVSDAVLRSLIEGKGDDPRALLTQPGGVTKAYGTEEAQRMFGTAAAAALDYTQAADPYQGTVPAWINEIFQWNKHPEIAALLRLGEPFPRFAFSNVPRYVWDRMPGTAIVDIARAKFPVFGKGRLGLGLERQQIEDVNIPHLTQQKAAAEYDAATRLGELIQTNETTAGAARTFNALQKKANAQGGLEGMEDELTNAHQGLLTQLQAKTDAQRAYKAADAKANDLDAMLQKQTKKMHALQEINAPDWGDLISRQAQGVAILTAAIGIRAAQDDDTKWSAIRVHDPISGGKFDIDTKWMSGLSQFLLPADVIVNFHRHTDWDKVRSTLDKEGWTYQGLTKAMEAGYHGKYTAPELAKDAAEAFLSLSSVLGGVSSVVDMATGRTGQGGASVLTAPFDFLATFMGQSMGAFTLPAKQFGDLIGSIYQPEAVGYTPEAPGKYGNLAKEVYQPVIQNVPGARELITPKVYPLTGQPASSPLSALRPFGVSATVTNKIEREIEAVGLPYAKIVPKNTGDRTFDNAVAQAYAEGLDKYEHTVLDNDRYKAMSPDLRRDVLGGAFGKLKVYAYYQAGKALGLDAKATYEKTLAPAAKEKIERWKGYRDELIQEALKENPGAMEPPPEPGGAEAR